MARWKVLVELLLSMFELLFLSLAVEALRGKSCQNSLPSGGGRSLKAKISGGVVALYQYIDTTGKAIDRAIYNETVQQTFRRLLSKLSKRREI